MSAAVSVSVSAAVSVYSVCFRTAAPARSEVLALGRSEGRLALPSIRILLKTDYERVNRPSVRPSASVSPPGPRTLTVDRGRTACHAASRRTTVTQIRVLAVATLAPFAHS